MITGLRFLECGTTVRRLDDGPASPTHFNAMSNESTHNVSPENGRAMDKPAVLRRVLVHFQGWAGRTAIEAQLVGETAKRYRVSVPSGIPGRCKPGGTCLVPKYAVTFS